MYRYILGGACLLFFAIFCTINSFLLARGAMRWAHDEYDQLALGIAAAVVPWVIAILPSTVSETWRRTLFGASRPSAMTIVVVVAWAAFVGYNLIGGAGTIAKQRFENVAEVSDRIDGAAQSRALREMKTARLADLPKSRPVATVEQLLAAEKTNKLWDRSDECRDATAKSSRVYCDRVLTLAGELETAKEAARLEAEIGRLTDEIKKTGPVVASADPQAEMLHDITGVEQRRIQIWLPAATPIVLEIGAALMLHVALGVLKIRLEPTRHSPLPDMPATEQTAALATPEAMRTASVASVEMLTAQRQLAEWFFRECARPLAAGSMSEMEWYEHYRTVCHRSNDKPLGLDGFRRVAARFIPTIHAIDGVTHYQGVLPTIPKDMAN